MKKLINPAALYDGSAFGMSQAVVDPATGLLFASGQVDWDRDFKTTETTLAGQTRRALDNLRLVLDEAGATVEGLLHVRVYVRGELGEHMADLGPILAEFLGSSRPALTGISVASLASPETLVEIEVVARVKQ